MSEKRYAYGVASGFGELAIDRVLIERETAKMVYFAGKQSTKSYDFRKQVPKSEVDYTPEAAVERHAAGRRTKLEFHKRQMNALSSELGQLPGLLKRYREKT